MLGASRSAVTALTEALATHVEQDGHAGLPELADQLGAVVDLLAEHGELRRTLTDSGAGPAGKQELARSLFGPRVGQLTLQVLLDAVRQRWSRPGDLLEALESLAQLARFHAAEQDGSLDEVEDELYRLARIVAGSPDLHDLLGSPDIPAERRLAVVRDLIGQRVRPATFAVVAQIVARPRGRKVDDALLEAAGRATERHGQLHAEATVPAPLEPAQLERLTSALTGVYGRPVRVGVVVDPRVLGGVRVQVGDEQIDGTIAHKLEQARDQLTG